MGARKTNNVVALPEWHPCSQFVISWKVKSLNVHVGGLVESWVKSTEWMYPRLASGSRPFGFTKIQDASFRVHVRNPNLRRPD